MIRSVSRLASTATRTTALVNDMISCEPVGVRHVAPPGDLSRCGHAAPTRLPGSPPRTLPARSGTPARPESGVDHRSGSSTGLLIGGATEWDRSALGSRQAATTMLQRRAVDRGARVYRRMMRARRLSDTARSEVMLAIAMIPVLILVVLTVLHLL